MTQRIVSRFPDVELWTVNTIRAALSGVKVGRRKSATTKDYSEVVVEVAPGAQSSPITQAVLINLSAYVVGTNGAHNSAASRDLASDAAYAVQIAESNPFTDIAINAGPYFEAGAGAVTDDVEHAVITLAADVIRT